MSAIPTEPPAMRCVAVIDAALPPGNAANAAAVMALTMGQRHPHLAGEAFLDAAGNEHPGLIQIGIPILAAPAGELPEVRRKALAAGLEVVGFPVEGQKTNDYATFRAMMRATAPEAMRFLGVMVYGARAKVGRIVGRYGLLRGNGG